MTIPFTKTQAGGNDFLLSWADQASSGDLPSAARAICDRHTGIGADGCEISGNGTRCDAGLLIESRKAGDQLTITTAAGHQQLRRTKLNRP